MATDDPVVKVNWSVD